MPRTPNAVDFWRGIALITIFVNHIPGIYFERFTHRNVSFSDSAELFVFLAGWSLRLPGRRPSAEEHGAAGAPPRRPGLPDLRRADPDQQHRHRDAGDRAAFLLDNPLILEWHNAAAVFHDPA